MEYESIKLPYKKNDLEIEFFIRERGDKTLVFLHGGGCSKEDFLAATEIEGLNDYTIFSFDFPGCGYSSYPINISYDVDDLCEITKLMIDYLELKKVILVGHSMGGMIGLLYILRYNNVKAFLNVEGNLAEENCLFSSKIVGHSFEEFSNNLFPALKNECRESKNQGLKKWVKSLETCNPKAFFDLCPSLVKYSTKGDLLKKYMDLDIPTIYLLGSENREKLLFLKKLLENKKKIALIPSSNHFSYYDNSTDFYLAICLFLEEINL